MTTRLLRYEEWGERLRGTELESAVPFLPREAHVLVVEDGDRIVACWSLIPQFHCEGLWIHPDHRQRGSVGRRLLTGMRNLVRSVGARSAMTAALDDRVRQLITAFGGQQLPGTHHVLPMGDD